MIFQKAGMFVRFRERIQRFMYGRYGVDSLSQWMTYFVLALIILNLFLRSFVVSILEFLLLAASMFRMLSKNIAKRSRENARFLKIKGKAAGWLRREKNIMAQRKDFHIYTCPNCRQKIRIPKGKGKIKISCPKCRTEFIKKS